MAGESVRQAGAIYIQTFRRAYQQLGMLLFISVVWFLFSFGPALVLGAFVWQAPHIITLLMWIAAVVFVSGPVMAALYAGAYQIVRGSLPTFKEFWHYFRSQYKVAAKITAIMLTILVVLAIDLIWFWQHDGYFIRALAIVWVQFILFWFMVGMYIFPFLNRMPAGALKTMRKAALMALDNFVVSIFVLLLTLAVLVFSVLIRAPLVFMMAGFLTYLHVTAHQELMRKYDDTELPTID